MDKLINNISGHIAYWLYEKNLTSENGFTKIDYIIGMIIFGLISVSGFLLVGFIMGNLFKMITISITFNLILNLMNRDRFHASNMMNCFSVTLVSLVFCFTMSSLIESVFDLGRNIMIFDAIFVFAFIKLLLSEKGKFAIRWIENKLKTK